MNSLRSRLILGSSLVAVIPLAVAMVLLSQRIESMVRTQASERLDAAMGGLQVQLVADGERIQEKIRILARDPLLKRLYLVRPAGGRDLSEYLSERRFLLGLDFLQVADTSAAVIADDGAASSGPAVRNHDAWTLASRAPLGSAALAIESLEGDSALTMAASAPILYEGRASGVARGGLVLDAGFLARLKQTSGVDLILRDAGGRTVTTTLGAPDSGLAAGQASSPRARAGRSHLSRSFPIKLGAPPHAAIAGVVSTASADQTIASLQLASALLGLLGLAIAILLGVLWSSQISRPVEQLAAFSHKLAQGEWDDPLTLHSVRELETLVAALDQMRRDLLTYRGRLLTSERQAAWSQMARKVAHEIKNPLTPIAISVADLKRSFELQRADFPQILDQAVRTIAEEVETLKRLLQEFSDFARLPAPLPAPCLLSHLMADLEALYRREVSEGRLLFSRPESEIPFSADAGQMRQALVNLIKNGLEAIQGDSRVTVSAAIDGATVEIAVSDDGPGLSDEERASLFVPGFTTKSHGSGLGLTIVERIVNDHQGTITVDARTPRGTTFRIRLPREPRA